MATSVAVGLIAGWLIAIPVPLLLMWAPSWGWIVLANVLLGVNQGLAWSMTVNMKVDLAGPGRRGLALGMNEAAGYLAATYPLAWGGLQMATGWLSDHTGRRARIVAGMPVQAAAIDALDQMAAERREGLVTPKVEDDDADVRAAAIRCLLKLRVPKAAEALVGMLQDSRADHRCAALWIVDQLKLITLAGRISEFAQTDPDPRIARIAVHVVQRLQRIQDAPAKNEHAGVSA